MQTGIDARERRRRLSPGVVLAIVLGVAGASSYVRAMLHPRPRAVEPARR